MTRCRGCGQEIRWGRTAAGKPTPQDLDGKSHFATCPKAAEFRLRTQVERSIAAPATGGGTLLHGPAAQRAYAELMTMPFGSPERAAKNEEWLKAIDEENAP